MAMSNGSDFLKFDNDEMSSPRSEIDFHNSDVESYSPADRVTALDYWFGKKYFECILAQDVFGGTAKSRSMASIDSEFQQTIRNYPYKAAYDTLRSSLSSVRDVECRSEVTDDYRALLCLIGTTIRLGNKADKHEIVTMIRQFSTYKSGGSNWSLPPLVGQYSIANAPGEFNRGGQRPRAEDVDLELPQYTTILKEKADQDHLQPKYAFDRPLTDPGQYRAVVSLGEKQFTGTGKSKAQAKHLASKEACLYLQAQHSRVRGGALTE